MQSTDHQALTSYRSFVEFVSDEIRREKLAGHRKMFLVLLGCFFVPAVLSIVWIALVRGGMLPSFTHNMSGSLILVFPVGYSIYMLALELKRGVKSPGLLSSTLKEAEWRSEVSTRIRARLRPSADDLDWLTYQFATDIENLAYRNRYLTALSGAVLFLLMEGIDLIAEPRPMGVTETLVTKQGILLVDGTDFSQFVGLALFLVLFYLSGNHACQTLRRYLRCLEGMAP